MTFEDFESRAWEIWVEIPEEYREGVDGLVVRRDAKAHPRLPGIYTLGECFTEPYPSDFAGPDTTRSVVVLYYGSFWRLSRKDPDFDWEGELWETITHELRHHLESLASEDALEGIDYAADENFKRLEGEPFDPSFYHSGERLPDGSFRVEDHYFIEVARDAGAPAPAAVEFDWRGGRYRIPVEGDPGDVCFIEVEEGLPEAESAVVNVVLVKRRGGLASLARWLSRRPLEVTEAVARAERVD